MKYQKGFAPLVIILLVVLGIGVAGGGYVIYKDKQQQKELEVKILDLQNQTIDDVPLNNPQPKTPKDSPVSFLPAQSGLPALVEAKRQAIYNAAVEHNYTKLVAEADITVRNSKSKEGPIAGFVGFLNNADQVSKDTAFRIIPLLLATSYASVQYPGRPYEYIWPSVTLKSASQWTSEEKAQLKTFMTEQEMKDYQLGASDYYAYFRLTITEDGKWTAFVVGD